MPAKLARNVAVRLTQKERLTIRQSSSVSSIVQTAELGTDHQILQRPLLSLRLTIIGRVVRHSRAQEGEPFAPRCHTFFMSCRCGRTMSNTLILNSGERAERNYLSGACLSVSEVRASSYRPDP
jgi:hypothetical protein